MDKTIREMEDARNRRGKIALTGLFCTAVIGIGMTLKETHSETLRRIEEIRQYAALERQMITAVDTNHNGIASLDEWARAYRELGIAYNDERQPHPRLSAGQMETYLRNHSMEAEKTR